MASRLAALEDTGTSDGCFLSISSVPGMEFT